MATKASLVECYQDAALQRYLMRPVAEQPARSVFYAMDTDVVASFLAPSANAIASPDQAIGMGEIFRSDGRDTKEAVAGELLDRIMVELSPNHPFILLSPIDKEIQGVFEKYRNRFLRGHGGEDDEAVKLHALLSANYPDGNAPLSLDVIRRALRLSHSDALSRVLLIIRKGRLLREGRITPSTHGDQLSWALKSAAPPFDSVERTWEYSRRRRLWRDRFSAIGRSDSDQRERDVEALTRLELTNYHLEQAETEPPSLPRLLYVTGDTSVMRAAEAYPWPGPESNETFASRYIRHPRAFLDELGVLGITSRSGEDLNETIYDWLTVLLGRFEDMLEQIPGDRGQIEFSRSLIDRIRQVETRDAAAAGEIQQSWSRFAESAVKRPATLLERLRRAAEDGRPIDAEALISELERDEREAWLTVLEVSVAARFAVEVVTPRADVPRDAPVLIMHERPRLTEFLTIAADWLDHPARYSHDRYRELRQAVRSEEAQTATSSTERDPSYGDFIAHAYLLAHQGQWRTAAILAALASDCVSEADKLEPSGNNGRESAYVEACCLRLTARSVADLEIAEQHCRRAIRLVSSEFGVAQPSFDDLANLISVHASTGQGDAVDPVAERFVAELLAVRAMGLELEWFGTITTRDAARSVELRLSALQVAEHFLTLARRASLRLGSLPVGSLSERALQKAVEMCCRAGLSLRLQFADLTDRQTWSELEDVFDLLKDQVARAGKSTELSEIVLALVTIARSEPSRSNRRALDQLRLENPVLSFDISRFNEMVGSVRRLQRG
ncbi:MAG: hypothetical protein WDN44_00180 [Sphingomonas sp.]